MQNTAATAQLPRMFTLDEVAEMTRTPVRSVLWWVRSGKLRATKPGRSWRVREEDLQDFLAKSEKPPLKKVTRPAVTRGPGR